MAPMSAVPPFHGSPALETTHPFHFKMCPAMLLGPKCNHDLGVLLRMALPEIAPGECAEAQTRRASMAMLEAMGDH